VNRQGLHARPISQFVDLVTRVEAVVEVTGPDGTVADGGSVFSMMTLAAGSGSDLTIAVSGSGAEDLLAALVDLIGSGFGEL
jgi:phosphotransferase system HPr (HPr) family protein